MAVIKSRDKLMFIWYQQPTTSIKKWYLVEVYLPTGKDQQTFYNTGMARLRWFIREANDSQTKVVEHCRYWPEIHELKKNNTLGKILQVRPNHVSAFLNKRKKTKHARYELDLDVTKHLLHGPFNFAKPSEVNNVHNRVHDRDWEALRRTAPRLRVDISDQGGVIPLRWWSHTPTLSTL